MMILSLTKTLATRALTTKMRKAPAIRCGFWMQSLHSIRSQLQTVSVRAVMPCGDWVQKILMSGEYWANLQLSTQQ